jgi:hypothetical protein
MEKTRRLTAEPVPVFLLMAARSGSTLTTRILNSHTRLASPCELCIPYLTGTSWKAFKSLKSLKQICTHYGAPYPAFAPSLLLRTIARRHLRQLTETILAQEGKQLLIVKDGSHARNWQRIQRLYADASPRYILLFRDVRGVVHSFKRTLNRKMERGFRVWRQATQAMLDCRTVVGPERCFALRYEDLVSEPAATMSGLVEFLGCDFEPQMLNYGQFEHTDHRLDLWPDPRYVASVNQGVIQRRNSPGWRDDEALLAAYDAQPDLRALNEQLGYSSGADETNAPPCRSDEVPALCPSREPSPACVA